MEATFYDTLPLTIAKAGGRDAITRCKVFTGPYQVQAVAWYLKTHSGEIGIDPKPPGIIIAPRDLGLAGDKRFPLLTTTSRWVVRRDCDA